MKVVRGIAVDNGGSEVRVSSLDKPELKDIIKIPNDFMTIKEKDFRVKEVAEPKKLCRVIKAPDERFLGIYAQGITGRAFANQAIPISSQDDGKTTSLNYYRQLVFAVAQDAIRAWVNDGGYSLYTNSQGEKMSLNIGDGYKYCLVVCVPIKEFSGAKDCGTILRNAIAGEYEVEFPLLDNSPVVKFELSANLTGVVPEGGIAIRALKNEIGEDEYTLVIDMGHVTVDIAIFQGIHLLGQVVSSHFAGSALIASVSAVLADEGYFLSEAQVQEVLKTKQVKDGKSYVDVSEIVDTQIENFVNNYLRNDITRVLNANGLNVKQVQNVAPLGEPMNDPQHNYLLAKIIETMRLEKAEVKILAEDLRYVNIQQALKFVNKLISKARV